MRAGGDDPSALREKEERGRSLCKRVLALVRLGHRAGLSLAAIARWLGIAAGTLGQWWRRWVKERSCMARRGRKRRRERTLAHVLFLAFHADPTLRVRTMHRTYPEVPRRKIKRIRSRALALRAAQTAKYKLAWSTPGAVWAMDFKAPPSPVEGVYVGVLVVRDLASGETLTAAATRTLEAREVVAVLVSLFMLFGAPLVMKNDNGSNLVAAVVAAVLEQWAVLALRSPPGCPSYNGSCEAGIGSISRRAEEHAAQAGHPGEWTCDDLEAARVLANHEGRPRAAPAGRSPEVAWLERRAFGPGERAALRTEAHRIALAELERLDDPSLLADPRVRASIERAALGRALCNLSYLKIRRR